MNIYLELNRQNDLSHNERRIADYILQNPHKVLEMSAKQLCQACFVSTATVYRFCSKLDLSGYSHLKMKLSSDLQDYLQSCSHFDFNFPVSKYQTHYEIIHNLKTDYLQTVELTAAMFDPEKIRQAAMAMAKAKVIDIYTSAGNIYFAQNFQFQMQEIDRIVHVPQNDYHQRLTAAASNDQHLAIIISFGGRGLLSRIIPRILAKNHTPMILISADEYRIEDFEPDFHFYIAAYEDHYQKISSFSTRLSILYILDVLYASYFKIDYQKNLEKKLQLYSDMVEGHIQ